MHMPKILVVGGLLSLVLATSAPAQDSKKAQVDLLASVTAVAPGGSFDVALRFKIQRDWHIYWQNPGDSGQAPRVSWKLPDGFAVGPLRYPFPRKHLDEVGVTYILEGTPTLLARITAPATLEAGSQVALAAEVKYLVCKESCLQEQASVKIELPVVASDEAVKPAAEDAFKSARQAIPADTNKNVKIAAAADKASIKPGDAFELLVQVEIAKDYHVQSNQPAQKDLIGTDLLLERIPDVEYGDSKFPEPVTREMEGFGKVSEFAGALVIRVPVKLDSAYKSQTIPFAGVLRFQACKGNQCLPPENLAWHTDMPIGQAAAPSAPRDPTDANRAPSTTHHPPPTTLTWVPFDPRVLEQLTASGRTVLIDFTARWCPNCKLNEAVALNTVQTAALVDHLNVVTMVADFTNESQDIRQWLAKFKSISVPLTVIFPGSDPARPILLRDLYSQSRLHAALQRAGPSAALTRPRAGVTLQTELHFEALEGDLLHYLLLALLGGFVMNLMPCVLPVVSIKVLSLVQQASQAPGRVFKLGLVFAGGMITVFLVLAGFVAFAGQTWGFIFQSRAFLVVMIGLLTAMGLSLFGVFTLTVPQSVGEAARYAEGADYGASFFKGVLAVLLGTPCSGPLLGATLGWAAIASQQIGAHVPFLLFGAIGVGMAFPYVILTAHPAWLRFVPRPGPWMETFKQAMGFLLLGTGVYLLYILPETWAVWSVLFALGVGLACWIYGHMVKFGVSPLRRWGGRLVAVGVIALSAWVAYGYFIPQFDQVGHTSISIPANLRPSMPVAQPHTPEGEAGLSIRS